jgi:hypothetical protein
MQGGHRWGWRAVQADGDVAMAEAEQPPLDSGAWLRSRAEPPAPPAAAFLSIGAMPDPARAPHAEMQRWTQARGPACRVRLHRQQPARGCRRPATFDLNLRRSWAWTHVWWAA